MNENLAVTTVVGTFEERATRRGEDIEVSRDVTEDFLADKCR
ncbi:hypothetical protein [Nocardiopsis valliformis]|nr:hypothetical protein [Nocardiopsis valliformis]